MGSAIQHPPPTAHSGGTTLRSQVPPGTLWPWSRPHTGARHAVPENRSCATPPPTSARVTPALCPLPAFCWAARGAAWPQTCSGQGWKSLWGPTLHDPAARGLRGHRPPCSCTRTVLCPVPKDIDGYNLLPRPRGPVERPTARRERQPHWCSGAAQRLPHSAPPPAPRLCASHRPMVERAGGTDTNRLQTDCWG